MLVEGVAMHYLYVSVVSNQPVGLRKGQAPQYSRVGNGHAWGNQFFRNLRVQQSILMHWLLISTVRREACEVFEGFDVVQRCIHSGSFLMSNK